MQWETYENPYFRYEVNVPTSWVLETEEDGRWLSLRTEDWDLEITIYVPDYHIQDANDRLQQHIETSTEGYLLFEAEEPENYRDDTIYGAFYVARTQWSASLCIEDQQQYLLTNDGSFYWWVSVSACGYSNDKVMWEIFDSIRLY